MSQIQEALSNFGSLIDPKTGIIKQVEIVRGMEIDPEVFLVHAEPCDTTPLIGIKAANRGAACSVNSDRAMVRACGESIERYCSSFFNINSFVYASENDFRKNGVKYVHVHDVYPFSEKQFRQQGFPYKKVLDTTKIRWTEGYDFLTNETIMLPASCVYVPYLFDMAVEPFTHMPISTGLAAGQNVDYCIMKGIMEIFERDALMLVWNMRLACPRVSTESCYGLLPEIDTILNAGRKDGPQWYINLLTLDINVPIISAALINNSNPPLSSFGIAANQDPVYALLLALEEAALTRMLLNRSEEILSNPRYIHGNYNTLRAHMLAHATSMNLRKQLNFLTDIGTEISFDSILNNSKSDPIEEIKKLGLNIFCKNITTSDINSYGFKVTRTIIPGLQPLDNDHRFRFLGGSRIPIIRKKYNQHLKINPYPHPFP
jgi:ribosomal protein S12 methylthiotransferase accessory factor